ncbi:hypothetical protein [Enterobacter quasiroggenkampii]|uniref:hypothetical protein n=1 Tax=Enterobacter quasiroggenkampii TaxID=2497436 RepID=UPI002075CF53|nr:hypothetical protein [Enterobacter quasiroggenkampii]MCM7167353.1 hypothetical protein [Enterobacter quasiroggenkampii]
MNVTDEALLRSGFTLSDLQKIKNNVERYGGTLEEAIYDLARRFNTLLWVASVCFAILIILVVFSSPLKALAWGLAIIIGVSIMTLAQPPVLSYKSWRYRKSTRD